MRKFRTWFLLFTLLVPEVTEEGKSPDPFLNSNYLYVEAREAESTWPANQGIMAAVPLRSELLARIHALQRHEISGEESLSSSSPPLIPPSQMEPESRPAETPPPAKTGLPALLKQLNRRRKQHLQAKAAAAAEVSPKASPEVSTKGSATETKLTMESSRTNAERLQDYLTTSDLEKRVIRQVEYYFGDHNLPRDRFMKEVLDNNGGWIPMETMLTFKRLAELSKDADFIMMAIDKSVNRIVQVDFAGRQLRRHPNKPLPTQDERMRQEVQERTLFVGGFDRDGTTLDHLLEFFEGGFDKVSNVRMRFHRNLKDLDDEQNGDAQDQERHFLGSVFVTFGTLQAARDFLAESERGGGGLRYKGRKLTAKFQREFLEKRLEDNDEFVASKAGRTLLVQGFDKVEMADEELADFFGLFDGAETVRKRVFRNHASGQDDEGVWVFAGSVFVCFETEEMARAFFRLHEKNGVNFNGDKLNVKWQVDFYAQKGKFKRDVQKWRQQHNDDVNNNNNSR